MDMNYVQAVMAGKWAEVGAPPPQLDDAARARAATRLVELSPSGEPAPMLAALGLHVEETQLPERVPVLALDGRLLLSSKAPPTFHPLLTLVGLAIVSLHFEASQPSTSDAWLVAGVLERIRRASSPGHPDEK